MFALKIKSTGKLVTSSDGTADGEVRQKHIDDWTKNCGEEVEYITGTNKEIEDMWIAQSESELTYADKRRAEYNELNQFEMIGEDAINGTTTHVDAIKAIKAKYPKS